MKLNKLPSKTSRSSDLANAIKDAKIEKAEKELRAIRLSLAIAEDAGCVRSIRKFERDEQVAKANLRAALAA